MNAGALHHVELYVSDLRRSREFWGWFLGLLGYVQHQEWPQGVSFRQGVTYLVFVQVDECFKDPAYHRCRVGLNHLAFHAASAGQVDEIAEMLRTRGVELLYPDRPRGSADGYAIYFEDPDRIKVELVAPVA